VEAHHLGWLLGQGERGGMAVALGAQGGMVASPSASEMVPRILASMARLSARSAVASFFSRSAVCVRATLERRFVSPFSSRRTLDRLASAEMDLEPVDHAPLDLVEVVIAPVGAVAGFGHADAADARTLAPLFGGLPMARLIHHIGMWIILIFAVVHIYFVLLSSVIEHIGTFDSIFSGYKFLPERKADHS
jgi:hypothetical protein